VLLDEPTWLALPSRHPFTRREALSLAELSGAPFITIDAADGGHMLELYRRADFQPRIVQHVRDLHTGFALVAAGLGLLFIPRSASRTFGFMGFASFRTRNKGWEILCKRCR
jgi:DNA-binding transcriptional LysR family regulator